VSLREACLQTLNGVNIPNKLGFKRINATTKIEKIEEEVKGAPIPNKKVLKSEVDPIKPVKFNKNQKASLEKLFQLMKKHKDDREADMLIKYLTDTNCMNYIKKYGE